MMKLFEQAETSRLNKLLEIAERFDENMRTDITSMIKHGMKISKAISTLEDYIECCEYVNKRRGIRT